MVTSTVQLLLEHVEKTVAAITLRSIHPENQAIMDEAIKQTLKQRPKPKLGNDEASLTAQVRNNFRSLSYFTYLIVFSRIIFIARSLVSRKLLTGSKWFLRGQPRPPNRLARSLRS